MLDLSFSARSSSSAIGSSSDVGAERKEAFNGIAVDVGHEVYEYVANFSIDALERPFKLAVRTT